MPSLPEQRVCTLRAGGLLPLCCDDALGHPNLPRFNHLPQIINTLQQQSLGILVLENEFFQSRTRVVQRSLESSILCLQSLLSFKAGVQGILKCCYALRRGFSPPAHQGSGSRTLRIGHLLGNRSGRASPSVLNNEPMVQRHPTRHPELNHFTNGLPVRVASTLFRSFIGHSSHIVSIATKPFWKSGESSDTPWNNRGNRGRRASEIPGKPHQYWLSFCNPIEGRQIRGTSISSPCDATLGGGKATILGTHIVTLCCPSHKRFGTQSVHTGRTKYRNCRPVESIPTRKPQFTAVFPCCSFTQVRHTCAILEIPHRGDPESFVQIQTVERGYMATIGRVKA